MSERKGDKRARQREDALGKVPSGIAPVDRERAARAIAKNNRRQNREAKKSSQQTSQTENQSWVMSEFPW